MKPRLLFKLLFCFCFLPFLKGQDAEPVLMEYYLEEELSSEWELYYRTFYEYDKQNRLVKTYDRNIIEQRPNSFYRESVYNLDDQLVYELQLFYNVFLNKFDTVSIRTLEYNGEGQLSLDQFISPTYNDGTRIRYSYDRDGCISLIIYESRQQENNDEWIAYSRSRQTSNQFCEPTRIENINDQGGLESATDYEYRQGELYRATTRRWQRGQYVPNRDYIASRDDLGRLIREETQIIDFSNDTINVRTLYNYQGNQLDYSARIEEEYVDSTSTWETNSITEYTFSPNGERLIFNQEYFFNSREISTQISNLLRYTYDEDGYIQQQRTANRIFRDGALIREYRITNDYTRDCAGNILEDISTNTKNFNADFPDANLQLKSRFVFYYAQSSPCDPDGVESMTMKVYPNPTTDLIQVQSALLLVPETTLRLISSSGQVLINRTANTSFQQLLATNNLPTGVYWIELENKALDQKETQRIVVNR